MFKSISYYFCVNFLLPQELGNRQKNVAPSPGPGAKIVAERHTVANRRHGVPDLKGDFGVAAFVKVCVSISSSCLVAGFSKWNDYFNRHRWLSLNSLTCIHSRKVFVLCFRGDG